VSAEAIAVRVLEIVGKTGTRIGPRDKIERQFINIGPYPVVVETHRHDFLREPTKRYFRINVDGKQVTVYKQRGRPAEYRAKKAARATLMKLRLVL
jgi:hypothetical protein